MATLNVPGRCHIDADGWLRGPINITHVMTPNRYNSGFTDNCRGMVQHTESGFEAGTVATFLNPDAQVSAFFSVGEDGRAHQYLPLGHGFVAWAEGHGNPLFRSCEFEDKLRTGDPMTPVQLGSGAQILEACAEYDGFPLAPTDDPANGRGVIFHGDGGALWGNHPNCPGSTRKEQRPQLIALAKAIRAGGPQPPAPKAHTWTSQGQLTLLALCKAELKELPSTVLRVTVENSKPAGTFAPALAQHINAVFAADTEPIPAGATFTYPGGQWVTKGELPLSDLAAGQLKTTPAQVLALTATHGADAQFPPPAAAYVNAVFGRTVLKPAAGTIFSY